MGLLKNKSLQKLASLTRAYGLTRLDRLLRLMYNPDKRRDDFLDCVVACHDDILFHVNTSSYLEWTLFFYGTYEPFIQKLMKMFIYPGNVCVDVGANIGIHTSTMARATGSSGKVYAFEPHPLLARRLQENRALNHFDWVDVELCALSDTEGTALLYGFDGRDSNQGTSTLCEGVMNPAHAISVSTTTLDLYVQRRGLPTIDFIKIDVEGFEYSVLQGARESIERFRPTILFEHNRRDEKEGRAAIDFMLGYSYALYAVSYATLEPLDVVSSPSNILNILAIPRS